MAINKKILDKWNLKKNDFIRQAKVIHGDRYSYDFVKYAGVNKKVTLKCKNHGKFRVKPNSHLAGRGCRKCKESRGERIISRILDLHGLSYIQEYSFPSSRFRYDFHLPDHDILIEFHGAQHYKPVRKFGGKKALLGVIERDKLKVLLAKANQKTLIALNHTDLDNDGFETKLLKLLKSVYVRWYKVNGKIETFKTFKELYARFKVPSDVLIRNVDKYLIEKYAKFEVMLKSPRSVHNKPT